MDEFDPDDLKSMEDIQKLTPEQWRELMKSTDTAFEDMVARAQKMLGETPADAPVVDEQPITQPAGEESRAPQTEIGVTDSEILMAILNALEDVRDDIRSLITD